MVFRNYLLHVAASCLLVTIVSGLLPKGRIRKNVQICGSLVVLLAIAAPVLRIQAEDIARGLSSLQLQIQDAQVDSKLINHTYLKERIKQDCEAYVLDIAKALKLDITVDVQLEEQDGCPYPFRILLTGSAAPWQKQALQDILESDLGIPKERQSWISP